jgi:hypothetical protein
LAFAFVTASIVSVVACGGNVVVDGPSRSGTGGITTTPTGTGNGNGTGAGTTTPTGAGGASCFNLPMASTLTPCGGSGSSGGMCSFQYCGGGNTWEANCTANACQCLLNNLVICTCALVGAGNICSGTPDCCFRG